MIKSMTAFARESRTGDVGELTWEVRTVNHRFLEPHIRLPEELRGLDTQVRNRLAARLQRGKVDCTLRYVPAVGAANAIRINRSFVEQLLAAGRELGALTGRAQEPTPFDLLRWPGVVQETEPDLDRLGAHIEEVLDVLTRDEPVGRRLDFLMQELNREANTLGSKSADVAVTREAVEMKVLIEQMREQVQNLE